MSAQHTPGPWRLHADGLAVFGANSQQVVDASVCSPNLPRAEQEANAEVIVRSVNAHAELVALLREAVQHWLGDNERSMLDSFVRDYPDSFIARVVTLLEGDDL